MPSFVFLLLLLLLLLLIFYGFFSRWSHTCFNLSKSLEQVLSISLFHSMKTHEQTFRLTKSQIIIRLHWNIQTNRGKFTKKYHKQNRKHSFFRWFTILFTIHCIFITPAYLSHILRLKISNERIRVIKFNRQKKKEKEARTFSDEKKNWKEDVTIQNEKEINAF